MLVLKLEQILNGEDKVLFEAFDESQTFFKVGACWLSALVTTETNICLIFYGFVGKAHTLLTHVRHMTSAINLHMD